MKKLLKYLLAFITVAAFWNIAGGSAPSISADAPADFSVMEAVCHSDISESGALPSLPQQISFAGSCRVHRVARRTSCFQRCSLEFVKCGKVFNSWLKSVVQTISVNTSSSRTEPARRLFVLGRLII